MLFLVLLKSLQREDECTSGFARFEHRGQEILNFKKKIIESI